MGNLGSGRSARAFAKDLTFIDGSFFTPTAMRVITREGTVAQIGLTYPTEK